MKLGPRALVEYRCDCGRLTGYLVRTDGVLELVASGQAFGEVSMQRFRFIPEEHKRGLLEQHGYPVNCGRHDRLIRGVGMFTPTKGRRRKVILRPVDGVDFASTPAALENSIRYIEEQRDHHRHG